MTSTANAALSNVIYFIAYKVGMPEPTKSIIWV